MYIAQAAAILVVVKWVSVVLQKTINYLFPDEQGPVSGRVIVDDTTEATDTTDGSLQTDGGLSVAGDAVIGDDLKLLSDSAVLSLGAGSDATLTHDGTTGLTIAATPISIDSTGSLDLSSTTGAVSYTHLRAHET